MNKKPHAERYDWAFLAFEGTGPGSLEVGRAWVKWALVGLVRVGDFVGSVFERTSRSLDDSARVRVGWSVSSVPQAGPDA